MPPRCYCTCTDMPWVLSFSMNAMLDAILDLRQYQRRDASTQGGANTRVGGIWPLSVKSIWREGRSQTRPR